MGNYSFTMQRNQAIYSRLLIWEVWDNEPPETAMALGVVEWSYTPSKTSIDTSVFLRIIIVKPEVWMSYGSSCLRGYIAESGFTNDIGYAVSIH